MNGKNHYASPILVAGKYNNSIFNRTDLHKITDEVQNILETNDIKVDYDNYFQFSSTNMIQIRAEPGNYGIKLYDT